MIDSQVLDELRAVVGERHVLVDADLRASYETDWTGRFRGSTPCVVRPAGTDEVRRLVEVASRRGLALVPQGGNTGLVGGSVPLAGEVVMSLRRLDGIDEVDRLARQVTVGAGATLGAVQEAIRSTGLVVGVDLAARDSATIGGMVATNAGGIHVVRHGSMRAQVVGVEAVTGDGRVVSDLAGLEKDNTGYDLSGLFCGSEGTLGVITRVRIRLVDRPAERTLAMVACPSSAAAVSLAARARGVAGINAIEAVWAPTLSLVAEHLGAEPPVEAPVVVLVEVAGDDDPTDPLADALERSASFVDDALVATGPAGQLNLWRFRESATEAISAAGTPVKLDVTLPASALASFADEVADLVGSVAPDAQTYLFGHLGDGNVHVNVIGSGERTEDVEDAVLGDVARREGSISAEHGIGTAKSRWLPLARSADELAIFSSLRGALDPAGICNPNVLRPLEVP
ncbi:MAG: FAD-binding oxidoreductase [Actinomycetota bacterium]